MTLTPPRAERTRGVALIVTLAILSIVCILCVSFVSFATQDRGATKSYAQSFSAEQIGLGGLDQVVAQIQAEIADPALSTNFPTALATGGSNNLYIPLAASNAVPQRMTSNAPNLVSLIGYSGTNLYTRGAGASNFASASSTLTNSANGRVVTLTQWNLPQLTTSTNGFPAPQWILMTRSGPQAVTGYNTNLANSKPLNNNYVVGRYAYTVYDTSGLLDINVAGYPSSAATTDSSRKGFLPWADLTQLTNSIQPSDVDNLVGWRNAATEGNYAVNVYAAATNNGFTRVSNGDTAFLGRQDLIKYAQIQNKALTTALPYLTTFSRELNGPTWGPTVSSPGIQYTNIEYQANTYNPRIPFPKVQAVFPRNNGLLAQVGEPLVKYRFPLSKLALLEKFMGTGSGGLSATDIEDIQKYFGLDYAADANGPTYRHWIYPTANTKYVHNSIGIMTLDAVAAVNREPDFFELLQAGTLAGSLGKTGRADASNAYLNVTPAFIDPDQSATLQTLRTGVNIIDQWDADSYPTTLTLASSPGQTTGKNVYGIEDLPYLFATFINVYAASSSAEPTAYLYFELWNPHQTPVSVPANHPVQFRIAPVNSSVAGASDAYMIAYKETANGKNGVWGYGPDGKLSTAWQTFGNVGPSFTLNTPQTDYREPILLSGTMISPPGASSATPPPPLDTVAGFALPTAAFPSASDVSNLDTTSAKGFTTDGGWQVKLYLHLVMALQYLDGGNQWHTYTTFEGLDDTTGTANYPAGTGYSFSPVYPALSTATLGADVLFKSDPRTSRFGPGFNITTTYNNANVNPVDNKGATVLLPAAGYAPLNGSATYRMDQWSPNDTSVASTSTSYADVDGVTRWGDARNVYNKVGVGGSPQVSGQSASRPVVLNRPFSSVGDLGYAFRDAPWKTIDFFSPNSADEGLLDLFSLSDSPVVAGRVNPNTAPAPVLTALLSGALKATATGTALTTANAQTLGPLLSASATNAPLANRADLVDQFMANPAIASTISTGIKTEQEAVVRALAESANTRTWNFLVDVIAQSGRYPSAATGLDNFVVDGTRRYWLHIAIDRYTGQVVDKQIEIVNQ